MSTLKKNGVITAVTSTTVETRMPAVTETNLLGFEMFISRERFADPEFVQEVESKLSLMQELVTPVGKIQTTCSDFLGN